MMKVRYATISKIGRRNKNEDAFRVVDMPDAHRFMGLICDGLGGHAKGEVASETVANAIVEYWKAHIQVPDSCDKVTAACKHAYRALDMRAYELGHCVMGTTLVMVSIENNMMTVGHVGDSRCYLMRPGEGLVYQTRDHLKNDYGWEVLDRCFFSYHPEKVEAEVKQFEVKPGDRILLCSDGLYKSMSHNTLKTRLMDDKPLEDIINDYDLLCEKHGDDNYTAIIMEIQ